MGFTRKNMQIEEQTGNEKTATVRRLEGYHRVKNPSFTLSIEAFNIISKMPTDRIIPAFHFLKNSDIKLADEITIHFPTVENAEMSKKFIGSEVGKHFSGKTINWFGNEEMHRSTCLKVQFARERRLNPHQAHLEKACACYTCNIANRRQSIGRG